MLPTDAERVARCSPLSGFALPHGRIFVRGGWIASSASAGVKAGKDHLFGTRDDVDVPRSHPYQTLAHIDAVIVYGKAFGTPKGDGSFGIVAEQIGVVYIGGQTFTPDDGPGDKGDFFHVANGEPGSDGASSDFTIREAKLKSR
jgi:hypothetical protein